MLNINFTPFPELFTNRFHLKRITREHINDIFSFRSDEEVMHYIPRPLAKTPKDVLSVIEKIDVGINNNESINWGICDKTNHKLLGIIGYVRMNKENHRAEVGYVLHKDYHRKGIMNECLRAVIDYGFETMRLNAIEAIIDPKNIPSVQLAQKNNFKRDGLLREFTFHHNTFSDAFVYSILRSEHLVKNRL